MNHHLLAYLALPALLVALSGALYLLPKERAPDFSAMPGRRLAQEATCR